MTTPAPRCAYCGHSLMLDARCDECDGWSGDWWVDDRTGEWLWEPCGKCEGTGTLDVCSSTLCRLDGKNHPMLVNQRQHEKSAS